MRADRTHVIVGAGHAGGRAAQAMRQHGFEGEILLVGEEPHVPYERPPLSKELIVTDAGLEKVRLHDAAWYAENRIELIAGNAAASIDAAAKTVGLADGRTIGFDRLMLTTGARVRRLPVPGAGLDGVFYLRTIEDSEAIRRPIAAGTEVAVIGGGFIGLEIAGSAAKRGAWVTVLEAADRLMSRSVAPEVSDWFARMHRDRGVDLRLGVSVAAIEGDRSATGVRLGDGAVVPATVVVIGIGILPNVEIAQTAGLAVDNGIVVDDRGRTSHPDIWAAGDVANQPNTFAGRRLRLESYQNAQDQAAAVARNLCGADEAYEDSLWVWSDQHDVNLQMTGAPESWDGLLWRGDPDEGRFTVFYLAGGRIVAVNTVNNGREMRPARMLMESGRIVDPAALADTSVKLLKLARG
ncbi:MAG: pyridine nucleotide-disulfide oxidoreductase [Rhodospirillaceae bacterium]|nr:pyridine nucleotide-disulfide oxidoreductase [Rhodospirillaceae bacterium]MYH35595.1 pyridine nucleotide-disulfide oxidoreductase [Rhodospirillaceae bacterium]MYK12687.1 pyridine nucleotide-disulfide oxidoreductase [Rhodospirillaceae bacterium]MYK58423.1 pyridine nucleotide-disulfide oxidoreductase [Rhodospirillaceae bacterium]